VTRKKRREWKEEGERPTVSMIGGEDETLDAGSLGGPRGGENENNFGLKF